jgi:hypothetical protein
VEEELEEEHDRPTMASTSLLRETPFAEISQTTAFGSLQRRTLNVYRSTASIARQKIARKFAERLPDRYQPLCSIGCGGAALRIEGHPRDALQASPMAGPNRRAGAHALFAFSRGIVGGK